MEKGTPGERIDARMADSFEIIQRILVIAVGTALVILSVMALWDTVDLVQGELQKGDVTRAITVGVDTIFLTVILLELLHTVIGREALARQVPDFIVIGITSAIRHGLSLVASASTGAQTVTRIIGGKTYSLTIPGPSQHDTEINLLINSAGVLLLVVGLWIVRHSFGRGGAESTEDNANQIGIG